MTNQHTDEMWEAFPAKRFANESHIAFVTMLAVGANNLCDEQLWKDLCNEAGRRLHGSAGYQAATASADAEWRALCEKLVGAISAAQKATKMRDYIDEYPEPSGNAKVRFYDEMRAAEACVAEALAEAKLRGVV
jgi:hypothetical protein